MKRICQALLVGMFAVLLLLSCQALVEHPEFPEAPQPVSLPLHTALSCPETASVLLHRTADVESGRAVRHVLLLSAAEEIPVPMPVRDGNGVPLTGQSYVRTVYNACRMEESAG